MSSRPIPESASSYVLELARVALENRKPIVRACTYVVRRIKAAARFARTVTPHGEAYAMYVRSRHETWVCVVTGEDSLSTRLIACEGCVLNEVADLLAAPDAFPVLIDQPVHTGLIRTVYRIDRASAAFIQSFDKYLPVSAIEAAVALDVSDAHFRRWRLPDSEELDRVDAIYVGVVDQTWALVTADGAARLAVLRGHHLDRLDQVHADRLAEQTACVIADI